MTVTCPACNTNVSASSRFCNHCGSPLSMFVVPPTGSEEKTRSNATSKPSSKGVMIIVWMIIGFATIMICIGLFSTPKDSTTTNAYSTDYATCLIVTPMSGSAGDAHTDGSNIEISVTNNCGHNLIDVEVNYKLYNSQGDVVGTATGGLSHGGFDPGETMKFMAIADQEYYERYKIGLIDGN